MKEGEGTAAPQDVSGWRFAARVGRRVGHARPRLALEARGTAPRYALKGAMR